MNDSREELDMAAQIANTPEPDGIRTRWNQISDDHARTIVRLPDPAQSATPLGSQLQHVPADLLLTVSGAFQHSLDPAVLLATFRRYLAQEVAVCGARWISGGLELLDGEQGPWITQFALALRDEPLGTLKLYGYRPIAPEQMGRVETLVALATLPLRNATLYQQMVDAAHRDALTGLGNRAAWVRDLEQETRRFERYGSLFALVLFDMREFKQVNDTWGHDVGDRALVHVAEGLRITLRDTDSAYRIGGDEFVALLPGTDAGGGVHVAERVDEWLTHHPLRVGSIDVLLGINAGVAESGPGDTAAALYRRADEAMYRHKRQAA
ncbi:MAG: GGDEF domain-containing protein [Halothiobacillaceae bacterium]